MVLTSAARTTASATDMVETVTEPAIPYSTPGVPGVWAEPLEASVTTNEHDLLGILFDRVPVGIAVYGRNLTLQSFNRTWANYIERCALCERSRIVAGAKLRELAPCIEQVTLPLFARAQKGEIVRQDGLRLECRGTVSYVDLVLYPLHANGEIGTIVEVATDATERVLAYQTLEERVRERTHELERRRAVAESMSDAVVLLNSNRSLQDILQRLAAQSRDLLGANCSAIFKLNSTDALLRVQASDGGPEECLAGYALPVGIGAVGQAVLRQEPVRITDTRAALPAVLAELGARQLAVQEAQVRETIQCVVQRYRAALAVPLIVRGETYGGIALYYEEQRDFTPEDVRLADTFAHQVALAIDNARLREQIEQAAVAAERNRIARDLHDSVTQTLFSANLIGDVLPRLWVINPDEAHKQVHELQQLTRGALAEMRMLLLELRPAQINQVPLRNLLKHLTDGATGKARIPIRLVMEGDCPLPPPVHKSIYRIAQEAVNNIAKHSDATEATVSVKCTGTNIELCITDNGQGFDPGKVRGEHLGLTIMRERAEEISATLNIRSCPGGGTCVHVVWDAPVEAASTEGK